MKQDKSQVDKGAISEIEKMRKELHKTIIMMCVLTVVSGFATFSYLSNAWFASNKEVDADDSKVTAETPTSSLFISPGISPSADFNFSATVSGETRLFPISTTDCKNWYYVSGWDKSTGRVLAKNYTKAEPDATTGLYTNSYEKRDLYAYSLAQFDVYTTGGNMDVYFDPTAPITVTYPSDSTKSIDKAIRIGLVSDTDGNGTDELVMVYAKPENAIGNSVGQTEQKFYAIDNTGLVTAPYTASDDWTSIAAETTETLGEYKAGSASKKLCTTNPAGKVISVYIWLEGTDGQALVGVSDNGDIEKDGLSVKIRLVGVPNE